MTIAKITIIGIKRENANDFNESDSLRSRSSLVVALLVTRTMPAGIINAINTIFLVQKPAAANIDAATIAASTSSIFFKTPTFSDIDLF